MSPVFEATDSYFYYYSIRNSTEIVGPFRTRALAWEAYSAEVDELSKELRESM